MKQVYSLGYAKYKDLPSFIRLLKDLEVDVLVDVRRFPRSRNPEFTAENLGCELPKNGMRYEFLGEALGGFRRGGYETYAETAEYKEAIRRLLQMAEKDTVAIMCLEHKSKHCHRRFIMQTLSELGVEVVPVE